MKNVYATIPALLGAILLSGCEGRSEPTPPARPVLSIVIEQQTASAEGFAGAIEPRYRASHAFRLLGRVIARDVNVGDAIRKGSRLAALDPVALDLAVRAAQADLASAAAQLSNAAATEKRRRVLLEQRNLSTAQFEAVQQAREAAEAGVTRARTVLDKALEQRSYADLRAEFDGVVTSIETEVGQTVSPGQPVVTLARPDVREAVIDAPDEVAASLREGAPFQVALPTDPARRIGGHVREIAPQMDALTNSRRVRISLDDPPEDFRLGATIMASLQAPLRRRIRIPASALLEQDGKTFVWLVDPETKRVSLREVAVAGGDGRSAEITSGLETGARVVTAGVHSLTPGQAVKISDEALP